MLRTCQNYSYTQAHTCAILHSAREARVVGASQGQSNRHKHCEQACTQARTSHHKAGQDGRCATTLCTHTDKHAVLLIIYTCTLSMLSKSPQIHNTSHSNIVSQALGGRITPLIIAFVPIARLPHRQHRPGGRYWAAAACRLPRARPSSASGRRRRRQSRPRAGCSEHPSSCSSRSQSGMTAQGLVKLQRSNLGQI